MTKWKPDFRRKFDYMNANIADHECSKMLHKVVRKIVVQLESVQNSPQN